MQQDTKETCWGKKGTLIWSESQYQTNLTKWDFAAPQLSTPLLNGEWEVAKITNKMLMNAAQFEK